MDVTVRDAPQLSRYEAYIGDQLAGFAAYRREDGLIVFTHTEIDEVFEGQGVGGTLARAALDDVRSRGLAVRADCPFIRGWIQRHPDYQDLLEHAER